MEKTSIRRPRRAARKAPPPFMSLHELQQLGDGKLAYIRSMTSAEARVMFPAIEDLPADIDLFALHGADGTPIALTDSHHAAIGHALGDKLEIAGLH